MAKKIKRTFNTTFSNYTEIEIVGEGGAGRIYKVSDDSGQILALKLMSSKNISQEKLKRFKNELMFCFNTQHPNIISVIDHGVFIDEQGNSPFYVMPLYNESLRKLITTHIMPDQALKYFGQLLDGVEAAHLRGVVHRDLKPENILFDASKNRLIVADFGIAQFEEEALYTAVETAPQIRLANFQYAAPEQRARGQAISASADIYALGLILNEIFTGDVPWGTGYKTIASVAPQYGYLDDLVSIMLRQLPQDRPSSIEAVKNQLIGRQNEFIVRQQLSQLQKTVIPVTDIDDPLIIDPPRLIRFDYDKDMLTLFFQQPVNQMWIWALGNMGGYTSLQGKGPTAFHISGNKAEIRADEGQVQPIIDYFKSWLPAVNRTYEEKFREEKRIKEETARKQLELQIEAEERRKRILGSVKI